MFKFIRTIILAIACFSAPTYATLLFDNGTTIDPTNTTHNDTYSATVTSYTIFDDFQLTSNSTITDINYSIFGNSSSDYTQTFATILDVVGGSVIIPTFSVIGSLTSNGLTSLNSFVPNGFDLTLSGLSINLLAGNYVLGISTDMVGTAAASIGSGDSGFGSGLVQSFNTSNVQKTNHMAFSIEGTTLTSSVPEPGTLALLALGLVGFGLGKRKKHIRVSA